MLTHHDFGVFDWDKDKEIVSIINTFLKKTDLGIDSSDIEKNEPSDTIKFSENMPELLKEKFINEFSKKEYFYHSDENGDLVRFEKNKESNGANKLFKLLPFFIQIIHNG